MPLDPPLLPERIAGYRIVSRLGSGGMGEVLLAEDTRLQRMVAIKRVLPAAGSDIRAARRLIAEARAVAQLDHPNICAIYEVGEDAGTPFIVMPVVDGETLASRLRSGAMPIADTVNIASQIADALSAAHERGILHRDIKPANVMVNAKNHVRVMDFGLATLAFDPDAQEAIETVSRLTVAGKTVGTPAYMSPEQARGEGTDARSDLFSLGLVLFEMVVGRRAFDRGNPADSLAALLTDDAPLVAEVRPEAPGELQRIISKSLRKSRDGRYQSAADMLGDLRNLQQDLRAESRSTSRGDDVSRSRGAMRPRAAGRWIAIAGTVAVLVGVGLASWMSRTGVDGRISRWTALVKGGTTVAGPRELRSLAVVPLVNGTGSQEKDYIADGITQTLIDSLSHLQNLKVISRNTMFTFKGRTSEAGAIAKQLGVSAVMTGAMTEADGQLVIDIELSDAEDASVILSHRYLQQPSSSVLAMQSEIAQDVARNLRLKLTGGDEQQLTSAGTANPEAYQLYLKGRFYENRSTPEALHQGIGYYTQAIQLDPRYGRAYAGLAQSYLDLGNFYEAPNETMPKAREYANQALKANPDLVDAHIILGMISLVYDWDWAAAAKAMTTSSGLVPGAIEIFSCTAHLLESTGHGPEAERELRKALVTDPLSSPLNTELGCGSYYRRRYDAAIQENRDALELDPDNPIAYWGLGRAYGQKKMYADALAALNKVEARIGEAPPLITAEIGYVLAASGRTAEAHATLQKLNVLSKRVFIDPYLVAAIHAGLGDTSKTFEWLDRAYDARSGFMVALASEPKWDGIRADPRFKDLVRRVGF